MNRRVLRAVAEAPHLVLSAFIVALLAQTFWARVGHPLDLEWMEGGMLMHAERVQQGLPLYVEPSLDFIPFIYPPLYHWVFAGAAEVFGLSYALGRTISMLGIVAAAVALVVAVVGEKMGALLGLGAAALFLTVYDETGSFFDLVRIDGLLMGLLTWALVAGRHGWVRAAGILLTLAYLTKHNAALFGVPILAWLWWHRGRALALRFAAWSVIPALAVTIAVQLSGDQLFLTYLLEVPSHHGFNAKRVFPISERELWKMMPMTTGFVITAAVIWLARRFIPSIRAPEPLGAGTIYWLANGILILALCIVMRGHVGGYINVLMPGGWLLALWAAVAIGRVRQSGGRFEIGFVALTSVLLAVQLWTGRWQVERYTPRPEAIAASDRLIETLSALEGEVLMPESPWLLRRAGHQAGFHLIAMWDIDHGGALSGHVDELRAAIAAHRWSTIVLAKQHLCAGCKEGYGLKAHYTVGQRLQGTRSLRPVTGWPAQPRYLYVPKSP